VTLLRTTVESTAVNVRQPLLYNEQAVLGGGGNLFFPPAHNLVVVEAPTKELSPTETSKRIPPSSGVVLHPRRYEVLNTRGHNSITHSYKGEAPTTKGG